MTTRYGLRRTPEEYERLRAQARAWEDATARLLDRVGLSEGMSCLDAGCGPGETMRLMAERVGPAGRVLGLDADGALGEQAQEMLRDAGHGQCSVTAYEIGGETLPGGTYDLVFARLLLFHLPERTEVLARLWEAVAPGGTLLVQDYDLSVVSTVPESLVVEGFTGLMTRIFEGIGCDVRVGTRLPALFAEAGIGTPDGTEIAGMVATLGPARMMLEAVVRGALPAAVARGVVEPEGAERVLARLAQEAAEHPDRPLLPPLLVGAWKTKAPTP
ncbi:methyltransferase domain-containing protein [Actinoplanes sp. NPDC051851]|uniref:methyltransferase domain-containing protein n=1 Tax=Actinoplanes sp. NPDC051851 TaxID=3154753 RepID=UPI00341A46C1